MFSRSVDVLVADLAAVDVDEDLLSVSELGRALGFASSSLLRPYLAAHAWMRRRLAEYLGVRPDEIEFGAGEHGKPVIVKPETDLSFNLSYSGWTGILAVGFRRDVGVDVETLSGAGVNPAVVDRVLTPAERTVFSRSVHPVRTYLKFWVRKEALAKARGLGVDENAATTDVGGFSPVAVAGYEITDVNLGDDVVAALAAPPGTRLNLILDETIAVPDAVPHPAQLAAAV